MDDKMMAMVGVPCRDRRARTAGRKPLSAIPSNWKLSLAISAWTRGIASCGHHGNVS